MTNLHQGNFVEGDLSLLVDETCLFMQFTRNRDGPISGHPLMGLRKD